MKATDFAGRLRDTLTERQIAKELRELAEEERYAFILEMLNISIPVALSLANSCLRRRDLLESFLKSGISIIKDASSIDLWLRCLIPRLGVRRTIHILKEHARSHPVAVESASYFLPAHIRPDDVSGLESLKDLEETLARRK